jgi:hypothetical protein
VEDNSRLVQTGLLSEGAHESSVVSVVYPNFSNGCISNASSERILCSAGSDGMILYWNLGSTTGSLGGWNDSDENDDNQDMDNVSHLFARTLCVDSPDKTLSAKTRLGQSSSLLFGIRHGEKMNWVTGAASVHGGQRNSIFVADTTSDITCYTIPMR